MEKKKYYITTAIAYASTKPHMGNTYEIILADALARFKRFQGYDVFLQTGTDEHGEKIETYAKKAGQSPKEYVDDTAGEIKRIWDLMDTKYDKFIRTTDDYHERQVQKMFKKFYDQGDIYKGSYKGKYCVPCECFLKESELVDGKCPECGKEVVEKEETAYFFRMSKYVDRLSAYYEEHPEFLTPIARKHEMVNNFIKPGLTDLCVSRTSFSWGIPVDFDPEHVVYVWLDALSNYITGLGYDLDGNHGENFKKYWPADVHIIGKDIMRFHSIYWPIFLMALDLPLPKQIYGHPWYMSGGAKMSKSTGNVLFADELVETFGVDATRYYVLSEMPFDNDGDITWAGLIDRYNGELANIFGNLVSRTVAMINKYFDGVLTKGEQTPEDDDLKKVCLSAPQKVADLMDSYRVADALTEIFKIFRRANKYIDETTPWVLAKDESKKERLSAVLYNLAEAITFGCSLLYAFTPSSCEKAVKALGSELRSFDQLSTFGLIPDGVKVVSESVRLFDRIDGKPILERVEKARKEHEEKMKQENTPLVHKPLITIDDFAKIELRVGKIIASEKMPKADKLLVNKIQIGNEVRTIVSGIAKSYTPEQIIGKEVVVVANLTPVKLRGVLSEGMILCADDGKGGLALVSPESVVLSGSEVR